MLLEAIHLTKNYAAHTALNDVSVAIPQGEIMGLLGPNGAGKSTLIRIFNRIIAPDEGTVLYQGQPLSAAHTDRMGYMPEERGLYKKMEIGEQVLYLARLKGMTRHDAVEGIRYWFKRLEMEGWVKKKVADLSKGMQQKIQFIVTVIHKPDLIILDEPFSGFDPINANLVKDEIIRLKNEGATIMLSTHRMESVEELCDNITLINKAHVVLNGSVRDVRLQHRSHTYTVAYEGQLPTAPPFAELVEEGTDMFGKTATYRLMQGEEHNHSNPLLAYLIPQVAITGFSERIPTINDIFISTVNRTA
jgi:ABC-2 type transport system ATP-binding protein